MSSMSNSAASAEEPPHKKRKMSPPPSMLSSLSDDMVMSCLARVSRSDQAALSMVSKSYRSLVASPDLYRTRSLLSCAENYLYLCLLTPPDQTPRWFILRRGKSANRLLIPIPSWHFQPPDIGNEHPMRRLRGGQRMVEAGETRGKITLVEAGESYEDSLKGSLCFFSSLCKI